MGSNAISNVDVYGQSLEHIDVVGFEVPGSPESSYNNPFPGVEDDSKDPPLVPVHILQRSLLNPPNNIEHNGSLPHPPHVVLNHLYIENRESARSVLGLGLTHRFRSKYVTLVLYKPIPIQRP